MPTRTVIHSTSLLLAMIATATPAAAGEPGTIDFGLQLGTMLGSGVPANDMPGYGIFGIYHLNERWALGLGYDRSDFDYEEPARELQLPLDPNAPPIDAKAEANIVTVSVLRSLSSPEARREWYVGGSVGLNFLDVPDVTGPLATGGTFDIVTETDRETIVTLFGGVRQNLGEHWFAQFTLRASEHFAAWEPLDRISGAETRHDDYFAYGGYLGFGYRF